MSTITEEINASDDKLRCFAINNFGEGQHAFADSTNLTLFKAHTTSRDRALKLAGL